MSTADLARFTVRWSEESDGLVLTHGACNGVLCDVEDGDTLAVLAAVCDSHVCERQPDDHQLIRTDLGAYCSCKGWSTIALPNRAGEAGIRLSHSEHVVVELRALLRETL